MRNSNQQRIKESDVVDSAISIVRYNMSGKTCRADNVSWIDETPDDEHGYRFHSENSQAASWDNSEAEGSPTECHGELQHLPEKNAEKHKSRAGIFNRLRMRLKSRFEQPPGARTTSSVRATRIGGDVEVGRDGTSMVHKKRTPYYRCVPNPPGCIPAEVMMRVEDIFHPAPNRPGQGERSTTTEGPNQKEETNHDDDRNRNEHVQENAAFAPNVQICKHSRAIKVLINNWIDPGPGCSKDDLY